MVNIHGKRYKSMTTENIFAVTAHGNVIYRNECKLGGHGWIASGLTPSELEDMKLAGIVYPYSEQ